MLVLTRKTNQSIMIGDDVEVSVLAVAQDKIRLGITAPREIRSSARRSTSRSRGEEAEGPTTRRRSRARSTKLDQGRVSRSPYSTNVSLANACTYPGPDRLDPSMAGDLRMRQSLDQFEVAFEQEAALERQRRRQLRQRAVDRSRARRIQSTEKRGNVGFGLLLVALTATVIVVTVVMFETLAWLMG